MSAPLVSDPGFSSLSEGAARSLLLHAVGLLAETPREHYPRLILVLETDGARLEKRGDYARYLRRNGLTKMGKHVERRMVRPGWLLVHCLAEDSEIVACNPQPWLGAEEVR